ncbi:alpha/beta fold hydrolase [Streptomyces sp. NPDC090080]|uniref:alpha/beta fold hydrolase n=1 Tax=Streptomyces sp. NPDC090080 TaxID=3365939 RepID=UPI0038211CAC
MIVKKPARLTLFASAAAAGLLAVAAVAPSADANPAAHKSSIQKPTVVLVHGAFADGSGWSGVIERLQHDGYTVKAPAVPLRDLPGDAAYIESVLKQTPGPIILVGHSYGGAVMTNAAASDPDVKALVYIAAFAPDAGESVADLSAKTVDHPIDALPLKTYSYPLAGGGEDTDFYIDPAKYRYTFLSDMASQTTASSLAASQRPLSAIAFNGKTQQAAWKTIPSWYMVAKQDHAIAPDLERYMAKRAKAHTVEVNAPHLAMVTRPGAVTGLIEEAATSTR